MYVRRLCMKSFNFFANNVVSLNAWIFILYTIHVSYCTSISFPLITLTMRKMIPGRSFVCSVMELLLFLYVYVSRKYKNIIMRSNSMYYYTDNEVFALKLMFILSHLHKCIHMSIYLFVFPIISCQDVLVISYRTLSYAMMYIKVSHIVGKLQVVYIYIYIVRLQKLAENIFLIFLWYYKLERAYLQQTPLSGTCVYLWPFF